MIVRNKNLKLPYRLHGEKGETMTIKEFDRVTTSIVYYSIYDPVEDDCHWLTRDVSQDPDHYRRNMVKLARYGDSKITHVYCMNNVIHVRAVIESKEHP